MLGEPKYEVNVVVTGRGNTEDQREMRMLGLALMLDPNAWLEVLTPMAVLFASSTNVRNELFGGWTKIGVMMATWEERARGVR